MLKTDTGKNLPVEEMPAYEEFTDRVKIRRELDTWVKNIQRITSPNGDYLAASHG